MEDISLALGIGIDPMMLEKAVEYRDALWSLWQALLGEVLGQVSRVFEKICHY